ncbi:MAG: TrkH family potassium uptake protein [Candidatus Aenigmarchaeota archaeon]|nr:TrkH family potassium uptake protein [Candidatus Aenigmarchaeota archaeon]
MRNILAYLGLLLEVFAFFLILPIIAAVYLNEPAEPFLIAALISVILGLYFDKTNKQEELRINEALTLTALSFLFVSIIGAIPYLYHFADFGSRALIDSFFESVSGFTTTGLTVFSSVDTLPKSLLLWRAETQWLGGIGIIIIFLAILSELKTSSQPLYRAQGYAAHIGVTIKDTARSMIKIYGAYTVVGILLLYLFGLSFFESLSIAFSSISTGGFAVTDSFYTSTAVLGIISALMILGATSFFVHDRMFRGDIKYFFRTVETRALMFLILAFSVIVLIGFPHLSNIFFEVVSVATTTGYSAQNMSSLPFGFLGILIILMFLGGSSASTAGGIKISRVLIAFKSIPWFLRKMTAPKSAIIPLKVGGEPIDEDILTTTVVFIMVYALAVFIASFAFMFLGFGIVDSFFHVISALGTVGLSTIEISTIPVIGKVILIACMFLGRLEIFPVLILLKNIVKRE